ncbi:MAG: SdrD B-like domain-containing protein [Clostridia bacterium]
MPNVSGYVYYDPTRTGTPGTGLKNVPVALYNASTGKGAVALTDATGAYLFTNVAAGTYKVIESWGTAGVPTPVDFGLSQIPMAQPPEVEPPLSIVTVPVSPLGDVLNAVTPNLLNINVVAADLPNLNFYDAEVGDKPLVISGVALSGANLITAADNGTFGSVPGGTVISTTAPVAPYPGVTPGFIYTTNPQPSDGLYTVINTRKVITFPWWPVSDHTTKIETGRMLTINGANPGAVIFTQPVAVTPNADYLLSAYVMNLMSAGGFSKPQLSLEVLAADGSILFYQKVNPIDNTAIPVWYENGFLFNTAGNSNVTVRILSEGPAANGNDYLIDDIKMYRAVIQDLLTIKKTASPSVIYAGTDVTFTVTVQNNSSTETLSDVIFKDILDPTLVFTPGSVTVNGSGVGYGAADPNTGFSLGAMAPGTVDTIQFHAVATAGASPVKNVASGSYPMFTSATGDVIPNVIDSNPIFLRRPLYNFSQASADLVESIAYQQTALSHIINAEGEKIQAMLHVEGVTAGQMLAVDASVQDTLDSISCLECVMKNKLKIVKNQVVGYAPLK